MQQQPQAYYASGYPNAPQQQGHPYQYPQSQYQVPPPGAYGQPQGYAPMPVQSYFKPNQG